MMHFLSTAYATGPLITAIEAQVLANMWAETTTQATITQLTLTPLDGSSASVIHATAGGAKWAGTQTAGDTIPQAAAIVRLYTAQRGRSYRGRVYLPWVAESVAVNGGYNSLASAAQNTAWGTFIAGMQTSSHELVVASYKNSSASIVIDHQVESMLATQRRRQPRPS